MAHLKPSQISRRNFVSRAGMLMTTLGVTGGIQSGLMDNIIRRATKRWGGEALAAYQPGAVRYMVEIALRAGFQTNSLFASAGHMAPSPSSELNFYSSPANVLPTKSSPTSKNAYLVQYPGLAMEGGLKLKTTFDAINTASPDRIGLATSEVIDLQTGQHTSNFSSRSPNTMSPVPAILHTSVAPPAAVQGINWDNGNGVQNNRGAMPDLAKVSDRTQFQGLFKDLPMYFTFDELKLIIGEIDKGSLVRAGAIDELDQMFLVKNVPGSQNVAQVSLAGRGQSQLSLLAALDATYNTHAAKFIGINTVLGGTAWGQAANSAISAFANQAATSFVITGSSGDWHSNIQALGDFDNVTSKQGLWNRALGNALSGLIEAASVEPDPHEPGKTILDSMLISISSEFTRTPTNNGRGDNGDGGQASLTFIGPKVKNGAFGNITNQGDTVGFDPATGADNGSFFPTEAQVWKTAGKLMGIQDATINMYVPANVAPLTALVK